MNEQWEVARNSGSLKRIQDFKRGNPEFPAMNAVDTKILQVQQNEVETALKSSAAALLDDPDELSRWENQHWKPALEKLDGLQRKFNHLPAGKTLAERIAALRSEAASIRSVQRTENALSNLPKGWASDQDEITGCWRAAIWIDLWFSASRDARIEALESLASAPKKWVNRINQQPNMQANGGLAMIEGWKLELSELPQGLPFYVEFISGFWDLLMESTQSVDLRLTEGNGTGFSDLALKAWDREITAWSPPKTIKEAMVKATWDVVQEGNEGDMDQLLEDWKGIILPFGKYPLEDIFKLVDSPLSLANLDKPIPTSNQAILDLIPKEIQGKRGKLGWSREFQSLTGDELESVLFGDSLNSRQGLQLFYTSGHTLSVEVFFERMKPAAASKPQWAGNYKGTQPGYPLRKKDGTLMQVGGNTIEIPAALHQMTLSRGGIQLSQSTTESVVNYSGTCSTAQEDGRAIITCQLNSDDGTSNPSCILDFDPNSGNIEFKYSPALGSPSFIMTNSEAVQSGPRGQEVWTLFDSAGVPIAASATNWDRFNFDTPFLPDDQFPSLSIIETDGRFEWGLIEDLDELLTLAARHPGRTAPSGGRVGEPQREFLNIIQEARSIIVELESHLSRGKHLPVLLTAERINKRKKKCDNLERVFTQEPVPPQVTDKSKKKPKGESASKPNQETCTEDYHKAILEAYITELGASNNISEISRLDRCSFQFSGFLITDEGGSSYTASTGTTGDGVSVTKFEKQ